MVLFCLGTGPLRAASESPWLDLLAQGGQDGAFERDLDLDRKPDRWLQHQDLAAGFMHYGQVMLEPAPGGGQRVALVTNGASVGLQTRDPIPIDASFSYLLEGKMDLARTASRGGEAGITIEWLDADGRVLAAEKVHRESREGERGVVVEVHDIPRGTKSARLRLEIVQTPKAGVGPSIEGRVAWDDIRFSRRPRSEYETGSRAGLFWTAGDPPVFTVRFWGLPASTYVVRQEVLDFRGRVVASDVLSDVPAAGMVERVWRPPGLGTGWFLWRARFHVGKTLLVERQAGLVVLESGEHSHEGFGIDCARPVGEGVGDRIAQIRPAFVRVDMTQDDTEASPLLAFLKWMKLLNVETFARVRAPAGAATLLDWIDRVDPEQDNVFLRTFRWVDGWFLDEKPGADPNDERWKSLKSRMERILALQGGNVQVGTFWPYLAPVDHWSLPPAQAGKPRASGGRFVTIEGSAAPFDLETGRSREVSEFVKTAVALKHQGVERLALPLAGAGGAWDARGIPTPYLAAWHQLQSRLSRARAWREAQPILPAGVDGQIFERDGRLAIVAWSDTDATWQINLGADVVAEDLMGNRVDVGASKGGSVFRLTPVPLFIQGVDPEVVKTLLTIRVSPDTIPSCEGGIPLTLAFTSHFTGSLQGEILVDLGPGWRVEDGRRLFSLAPGERWSGNFTVAPSAPLVGHEQVHPVEVSFRLFDRGRERILKWSHVLSLAPVGFSARHTVILPEGKGGLAELFHEVVSTSAEPMVLASVLTLPGREDRWTHLGTVQPGAKAHAVHRFSPEALVPGASVTVVELGGQRRFWRMKVRPPEFPPSGVRPGGSVAR